MKKIFFLGLTSLFFASSLFAQVPTPPPGKDTKDDPMASMPYRDHPQMPAFNILLLDSTTTLNTYDIPKGQPTVIMNFMPDCDHCQKLTEKLLKGIDTLKHMHIYMVSPMEIPDIRKFAAKFDIAKYKNITIGKDKDGFCPQYYRIRFVPFLIVYDKNKMFVETFENTVDVQVLADAARKRSTLTAK